MIFSFSLIFLPAKRYFSSSRNSITFRCSVASIHRTNKYPAVNWLRTRPEPNKLATHFLQQYAQMARWPLGAPAQKVSRQREPNDETVRVFFSKRRKRERTLKTWAPRAILTLSFPFSFIHRECVIIRRHKSIKFPLRAKPKPCAASVHGMNVFRFR